MQKKEDIPESDESERTLSIHRILNAPCELVFKVWTDPDHISQWWGPNGFKTTIHKMDVKTGGEWNLTLHGPDGTDYKNESIFLEILEPEKIVFDHISFPKFKATITFKDLGNKTELNWKMVFRTVEEFDNTVRGFKADDGLKQNVERLQEYLLKFKKNKVMSDTTDREVIISRILNAPRELVYKAWTTPEHIIHWFGPDGFTTTIQEMNVEVGGYWRFIMHAPDGTDFQNRIKYEEVVENEKLVYWQDDGTDDYTGKFHVVINFEDFQGKTKLSMKSIFASAEILKELIKNFNVIEGGNQNLERLEGYLKKM